MPVVISGQMAPGRVSWQLAKERTQPCLSRRAKVGSFPSDAQRSSSVASQASRPITIIGAGISYQKNPQIIPYASVSGLVTSRFIEDFSSSQVFGRLSQPGKII